MSMPRVCERMRLANSAAPRLPIMTKGVVDRLELVDIHDGAERTDAAALRGGFVEEWAAN